MQAPFIRVAGRCVLKLSVRQLIDVNYISRIYSKRINRDAKKRTAFPRDNFDRNDKKEHFSLYLKL